MRRGIKGVERANLRVVKPRPAPSPTTGDVKFGSDAAAELAAQSSLSAADFKGKKPSGAKGFTVADVRRIAGK